jgi:hypothetical protein
MEISGASAVNDNELFDVAEDEVAEDAENVSSEGSGGLDPALSFWSLYGYGAQL